MSHVVTRAGKTRHRHVKHIGALSPGLAPHPGEASPGRRMDPIMKVLEVLENCAKSSRANAGTIYIRLNAVSASDRSF